MLQYRPFALSVAAGLVVAGARVKQKLLTNNKDGIKVMTMLLSSLSRVSVAPRCALRAPVWFVMLAALMFAGEAWGQREMSTALVEGDNAIPVSSAEAFTGQTVNGVDLGGDRVAHVSAAGNTTLDPNANDFLNPNPNVNGVVDWILVQARVVDKGAGVPTASNYCTNNICVTKAVLLFDDGSVSDADADDLADRLVTFEDLEFDNGTQDLHIAVYHRNHLAIMSAGTGADEIASTGEGEEEVLGYDLDVATNIVGGEATVSPGLTQLPSGKVAMRAGKVTADNAVNIADANDIVPNFDVGGLAYTPWDVDMNGFVNVNDRNAMIDNLDTPPEVFSLF